MQEEIAALEQALQEKRIRVSVAGSIAEAAVGITNVFSTAQKTADLYLHEIACMKADTEAECAKMIAEAKKQVEQTLSDGEKQIADLNARYQIEYERLQQLQAETHAPEQLKKCESCEGIENGK